MKRTKVLGFAVLPLLLASCGSGCASHGDKVTPPLAIKASAPVAPHVKEPAKPVLAPPPAATPSQLPARLETLTPYFGEPHHRAALLQWHRANLSTTSADDRSRLLEEAAGVFDALAQGPQEDARSRAARYLSVRIAEDRASEAIAYVQVAQLFEQLAESWPLMADDAWVRAATLYEKAGENAKAEAVLTRFGTRFCVGESCEGKETSVHSAAVADLETFLLLGRGEVEQATQRLERLVAQEPRRLGPQSWAQLSELRDSEKGRAEARFELARRFPNHALGKAALGLLEQQELTAAQKVQLAESLFEAGNYQAMRRLLAGFVRPSDEACKAWVLLGKAVERTNRRKKDKKEVQKAFDYYEKALACEGVPRAEATFLGGRNRLGAGKIKEGLALLEAHVAEFPTRSTADDAQLLIAKEQTQTSENRAHKTLVDTLRRYPEGDMADSVAWALVEPHLVRQDWAKVLKAVEEVLALAGDSIKGRHWGRYEYWRARAQLALGQQAEALEGFEALFVRYPLSYYAVLAFSRLKPLEPERAAALVTRVSESAEGGLSLGWTQALWENVHMRRAIELARMAGAGPDVSSPLTSELQAELAEIPKSLRGEQWPWLQVEVLQLGGAWSRSMRLARTEEVERPLAFPTEATREPWMLAYPKAFSTHVEQWASERKLPSAWLWGVMRVESNFDPSAVSWANAIGLMQIILPTAENLVRGTEHAPTRDNLMRPEVAVELGSKYLARLLTRHHVLPLASAGYNAGGGAVGRWRRQFGDVEVDEFVERIPYREAHLYAKSVTQTWARYLWLYQGEMAALDLRPVGHPDAPRPEASQPSEPQDDSVREEEPKEENE